jgi:DNA replication protein
MAMNEAWKIWAKGISYGLEMEAVQVPAVLLMHYRKLGLQMSELVLLLELVAFKQNQRDEFPSILQLEQVTGMTSDELSLSLRHLMQSGWITIEEMEDPTTGIHSERYNLTGMYQKIGQHMAEEREAAHQSSKNFKSGTSEDLQDDIDEDLEASRNLFAIFEKEFARPLTPMECETISGWLDQDGYPEELILLSLKEAVFAGKVHFRYIDRILLEWSRNRVKTAEDAKAYTQRFRAGRA